MNYYELVITYSGSDSFTERNSRERSSKNFRSQERKFQGVKVLGIPYHGTFAPGNESS